MNHGYLIIPRSLLQHPKVANASIGWRNVLFVILEKAAFAPCTQDDRGRIVHVNRGQLSASKEQIARWAKTSPTTVLRAIACFEREKILDRGADRKKQKNGNQEKMLLTVSWPGIFDNEKTIKINQADRTPDHQADRRRTVKEIKQVKQEEIKEGNAAMGALAVIGTESLPCSKEKKKSKRLNEEQQETLEWLLSLELDTDDGALRYWAANYSKTKIEDAYFYMLAENNKSRLKTPAGFIRSILDGKIVPMDKNAIVNKDYAEKFRKAYPFIQLKLYEKYCKSLVNDDWEISFSISKEEFRNYLDSILEKSEAYV